MKTKRCWPSGMLVPDDEQSSRQVNIIVNGQLPNGKYKTINGSTLEISGKHGGIATVDFDWLEEGGCIDCQCEPYPEKFENDDWRLIWHCEYCGGGNAKLQSIC